MDRKQTYAQTVMSKRAVWDYFELCAIAFIEKKSNDTKD